MGADFILYTINKNTKNGVKTWYAKKLKEVRQYYGEQSYTGSLCETPGVTIIDKFFPDRVAAEQYLQDNCVKWENALVVSYRRADGVPAYILGALVSC